MFSRSSSFLVFSGAFLLAAGTLLAQPADSQPAFQIQRAEMAIPFGTVAGRLLTVNEYLVFIDDEKPEASFAVARRGVKNLSSDGAMVTLETARAGKRPNGVAQQRELPCHGREASRNVGDLDAQWSADDGGDAACRGFRICLGRRQASH